MSRQLQAFCHACEDTFSVPAAGGEPASLVCPSCGSDFVEVVESNDASGTTNNVSATGAAGHLSFLPGGTVAVRISSFGDSSTGLTGVVGGDYNLTHAWDLFLPRLGELSQGLNIGDFSFESALDRIIDHLADAHQPVQTPADSRVVAALPRTRFSVARANNGDGREAKDPSSAEGSEGCGGENDACVVCHDVYKEGDEIVTLPCGHFFHDACIAPWFQERNTCPVCRLALPLQHDEGEEQGAGEEEQGDAMDIDEPEEYHDPPSASQQESAGVGELRNAVALEHDSSRGEAMVEGWVSDGNENSTNGGGSQGRDGVEGRGEDLRTRINGAQQELEVLQRRLSEQISEHQRLRGQLSELQTQRSQLHTQYYSQQDSSVRLEEDRAQSMLSRLAHRLRNALGRDGMGAANSGTNRQPAPHDTLPTPFNPNRQGTDTNRN